MFCADYVAAFVYHAIFTVGTVHLVQVRKTSSEEKCSEHGLVGLTTLALGLHHQREGGSREGPWLPATVALGAGLLSGLAASITLFPFDFVRASAVTPGVRRILSAGSTVPYAGALFGVYFAGRQQDNTASQMRWAIGASCCAVAAEAPLDHAKRAMMGSTRLLVGANLLFVPFAAMMLVMYDKAASRAVRTVLHPQL